MKNHIRICIGKRNQDKSSDKCRDEKFKFSLLLPLILQISLMLQITNHIVNQFLGQARSLEFCEISCMNFHFVVSNKQHIFLFTQSCKCFTYVLKFNGNKYLLKLSPIFLDNE